MNNGGQTVSNSAPTTIRMTVTLMTARAGVSDTASQAGGSAGNLFIPIGKKFKTHITYNNSMNNILLSPHRCDSGNLNGHYYKGPYQAMTEDGVVWYTWHGWWYSIKSVVMMVRAADLEHPQPDIAQLPRQLDPSKAAGGEVLQGL